MIRDGVGRTGCTIWDLDTHTRKHTLTEQRKTQGQQVSKSKNGEMKLNSEERKKERKR